MLLCRWVMWYVEGSATVSAKSARSAWFAVDASTWEVLLILIVHPTIWVGRRVGFACGTRSVKGAVIEGGGTPAIVGSIDYWVDFAKQAEWLIERAAEVMAAALGAQNLTEETWILDVGCGSGLCALTLAAASPAG